MRGSTVSLILMLGLAISTAQVVAAAEQDPTPPPPGPTEPPQPSPPPTTPPPTTPPPAPKSDWRSHLFVGGGIGLSFGTIDYVEIAPIVGYRFHPRVSAGLGLLWRYRDDSRYSPSIT